MNIGMIFPGYGNQFVGMGKELYDQSRIMQEFFEEASNCLNQNFVKLCFASSEMELSKIEHAYPALFLLSCSLYAVLEHAGVVPTIVAGYNQGEYAALFAGKSINFPDGLYLLSKYASILPEYLIDTQDSLLQVEQLKKEIIKQAQEFDLKIIAYNSPTSHVVLIPTEAKDTFKAWVINHAGQVYDIDIGFGFHNERMVAIAQAFKMYLEKVDFKDPTLNVLSTSGEQLLTGNQVKTQILQHMTQPLYWTEVVRQLHSCDMIIELGSESRLMEWIKQQYPDKIVISLRTLQDLSMIQNVIEKGLIDKNN